MTLEELRREIATNPILGSEDTVVARCHKIMSKRVEELEKEISIDNKVSNSYIEQIKTLKAENEKLGSMPEDWRPY
jgi:hypothetical protein